jgi:DNA primase
MGGLAHGTTNSYDEDTIENVITALGLDVEEASYNDWLVLCPFHNNTRDPSMTISKDKGIFYCLNPSCNETGTLVDLVAHVESINGLRAVRFIEKHSSGGKENLTKTINKTLAQSVMPTFDQEIIEKRHVDLMNDQRALHYMHGRGFTDETIEHFKFGYSAKQDMIMTPMHSINGTPVGVIGRTLEGKRFKNSVGLPVRQTLFNIHRARRAGGTVIVNESNFDSARVHQAGFECVVASLGGNFSELKLEQLDRNFDTIVIMTDDDPTQFYPSCAKCTRAGNFTCLGHRPGLALGKKLAERFTNKRVYWAYTGEGSKRMFGKDAGDMTDEQIRTVIENKISAFAARKLW